MAARPCLLKALTARAALASHQANTKRRPDMQIGDLGYESVEPGSNNYS